MFTASILVILNALHFNAIPVSEISVPASDLGMLSLRSARGPNDACAVAVRTDPGAFRIRAAHRTSSKTVYNFYDPTYDETLETSNELPIEIMVPGESSSEYLILLEGETTIMLDVSESIKGEAMQPVSFFAKHHFVQFVTCNPKSCSCKLEE